MLERILAAPRSGPEQRGVRDAFFDRSSLEQADWRSETPKIPLQLLRRTTVTGYLRLCRRLAEEFFFSFVSSVNYIGDCGRRRIYDKSRKFISEKLVAVSRVDKIRKIFHFICHPVTWFIFNSAARESALLYNVRGWPFVIALTPLSAAAIADTVVGGA